MILLDTNIIIDAHYGAGDDRVHARNLISSAVTDTGVAINCVALAELYAGPRGGEAIEEDMLQALRSSIFQLAQHAFVGAPTCGISLLARDQAEAKLPAYPCLISLSVHTRS